MASTLQKLKDAGGFISAEPVRKQVTWTRMVDGAEKSDAFDVFIRRRSFGAMERLLVADDDQRSRMAAFLADSILLGEEKEPMTYEDAFQLDVSLGNVLIAAVHEVNGTAAAKK